VPRFPRIFAYLDPEVEWSTTDAWIERATYRGHDGVRRYLGSMAAEFEDVRAEPVELIDAGGEQVVSPVRISGRGGKRCASRADLDLRRLAAERRRLPHPELSGHGPSPTAPHKKLIGVG
jgi:hypothetical protein